MASILFAYILDIFESFLDHPPLILPNETPRLDLSQPIPSPELQKEVTRLRTFLWGLDQDELPANQRTRLWASPNLSPYAYHIEVKGYHQKKHRKCKLDMFCCPVVCLFMTIPYQFMYSFRYFQVREIHWLWYVFIEFILKQGVKTPCLAGPRSVMLYVTVLLGFHVCFSTTCF